MPEDISRRAHLGQNTRRNAEPLHDLLIPDKPMNIKKHGSGGVGIIRGMNRPLGKIPDQPAVHRTEQQLTRLGPRSDSGHVLQNPSDLGRAEISIRNQSRLLPYLPVKAVLLQLFDHIRGAAALPNDGIIYRLPRVFIPEDGGFPLVCDADGPNLVRSRSQYGHGFHSHRQLGGPDFHGIMFHPARLGINLCKFLLRHGADIASLVKQDAP